MEFWARFCFDLECLHEEPLATNLSILSVSPEMKDDTHNHFQHNLLSTMYGFCCEVNKVFHYTEIFSAQYTYSLGSIQIYLYFPLDPCFYSNRQVLYTDSKLFI